MTDPFQLTWPSDPTTGDARSAAEPEAEAADLSHGFDAEVDEWEADEWGADEAAVEAGIEPEADESAAVDPGRFIDSERLPNWSTSQQSNPWQSNTEPRGEDDQPVPGSARYRFRVRLRDHR